MAITNPCTLLPSLEELMLSDSSAEADPYRGQPQQPVRLLHYREGKILELAAVMPAWAEPIAAVALNLVR
jgi:hypothetical protein